MTIKEIQNVSHSLMYFAFNDKTVLEWGKMQQRVGLGLQSLCAGRQHNNKLTSVGLLAKYLLLTSKASFIFVNSSIKFKNLICWVI